MRLVLVFVALLLSLPYPRRQGRRDMSWTIIGFVWNLSRPMAPGAALSAIPRMSRIHHARLPGFHDPRRFHLRADACRFFLTNESDSDFGIIWDEAVFVDGVSNAAEGCFTGV